MSDADAAFHKYGWHVSSIGETMKELTVKFEIIGGVPALVTDKPITGEDAEALHNWMLAVREAPTAFIGTPMGIDRHTRRSEMFETTGAPRREDIDPKNAGFSTDPEPETDKRHGVTVEVGGEFSDFTRDGFVIHVDDKVARGLVHAIGHLMASHHDDLPLIMLASVMGTPGAREFDGLAKLGAALVAQGVENVEVGGVPLIKS